MSEISSHLFKPALYYYEHCPYCIRVLLFSAMAKIELEHHVLLNDDEQTPISMVGAKIVPILEHAPKEFMGESLDIIDYLSQYSGVEIIKSPDVVSRVDDFLSDSKLLLHKLTMPRWAKISFGEFASQSAIDYFTYKKTQMIGDFDQAESQTDALITELQASFDDHKSLFKELSEQPMNADASIMLFSALNGLYVVKEFSWPDYVWQFMQRIQQESGIQTSSQLAI